MDHREITRDISASMQEFARGIRAAFPDAVAMTTGWQINWLSARAEVSLIPLPDLRIASITLPRQRCHIVLSEDLPGDAARLLARMDQYQQRGGG